MRATRTLAWVAGALLLGSISCQAETVAQAVARIARAKHLPLPAAEAKPASRTVRQGITLVNGAKDPVQVYLYGPESKRVILPSGKSADLALKAGKYQVAAEATAGKGNAPTPVYGIQWCQAGRHYWLRLYPAPASNERQKPGGANPQSSSAKEASEHKQVEQAIERIKRGPHSAMPPPTSQYTTGPVGKGMTLENHTPFNLIFYFKGPVWEMVRVPAGNNIDIALVVGEYEVAVEAEPKPGMRVQPFYGKQDYQANAHYWLKLWAKEL